MSYPQSLDLKTSDEENDPTISPVRNSGRDAIQKWVVVSKIRRLLEDQARRTKLTRTKINLEMGEERNDEPEGSVEEEVQEKAIIPQSPSPSWKIENVDGHLSELEKKVIRQMEHYFGDYNLPHDRFMNEVIGKNEGWIPMSVMITFPRLAALSQDPYFIMRSTLKSKNGTIEVDFVNERIRRCPRHPCPLVLSNEQKNEINARTLHVRGFAKTTSLDELLNFFEGRVKDVLHVRRKLERKSSGDDHEHENRSKTSPSDEDSRFLGSVFVTFGSRQSAKDFLDQKVEFQGQRLISKWHQEHFVRRAQFNDTFDEENIQKTVWVGGFDNLLIHCDDLAEFFSQFKGAETVKKRKMRQCREEIWKFIGSVFVTFEDRESAEAFLALPNLNYNGDRLRAKFQLDFYKDRKIFQRKIEEYLRCTDRNNN